MQRKTEFSVRILFHNLNFEEHPAKVMFAFAVIYFTAWDVRIYCTLKCHSTVTIAARFYNTIYQHILSLTYFLSMYSEIPKQLIILAQHLMNLNRYVNIYRYNSILIKMLAL